jgi:protoheme ferro-lyase
MELQAVHIIQLWHYVDTLGEEYILPLIEEMSEEYEDKESAEIAFISLWMHFSKVII